MIDWLTPPSDANASIRLTDMLIRMIAALLFGLGVALVFRWSHGRNHARATTLTTTLVLLSLLIALVSMVIGSSVAMAFSLVGALSIVRFRTVVEDTRDTAFVIFAVVVGMSAGAGQLLVPMLGLPIVGATAIVLSLLQSDSTSVCGTLTVRIGLGRDAAQLLNPLLAELFQSFRMTSAATTKQGAAIDLQYSVQVESADRIASIVMRLNQTEGIQSVDLKAD